MNLSSITVGVTPATVSLLSGTEGVLSKDQRFEGMTFSAFLRLAIAIALKSSDINTIYPLLKHCKNADSFEKFLAEYMGAQS